MATFSGFATRMTEAPRRAMMAEGTGNWAIRLLRASVLCSLFSILFLQEYFQASSGQLALSLYSKAAGEFRTIDLVIFLLVAIHVVALACSRARRVRFPRRLTLLGLGFLCSLVLAMVYGATRGGTNLFFDWRGLALGVGLFFVWTFWIQTPIDLESAIRIFSVCVGLRLAGLYWQYLTGGGEILQGVRIPIFDGPAISVFVFASLLALSCRQNPSSRKFDLAMLGLAIASASMVVLCFRRTYWVELTVGGLVLILFSRRRRASSVLKFAAALAVAAILLGAPFYARLQSFNLFQTSSQFSEDNGDHLDDLLDAWDQLQQSPFLGAGLGMPYPTWRIRNWKSESVMVHNAPIHVWLRYGLCGLVFYLWFHAALFRWLKTRIRIASGRQHAFLVAALAFLVAQFAVSLTFAPWPFSELQSVTLISFLLTGAAVPSPHRHSSLNI